MLERWAMGRGHPPLNLGYSPDERARIYVYVRAHGQYNKRRALLMWLWCVCVRARRAEAFMQHDVANMSNTRVCGRRLCYTQTQHFLHNTAVEARR